MPQQVGGRQENPRHQQQVRAYLTVSNCGNIYDAETPIYAGSAISIFTHYLLMLNLFLRHSLTKEAMQDILRLLVAHLPSGAKICNSVYRLLSYFGNATGSERTYYWTNCMETCEGEGSTQIQRCTCSGARVAFISVTNLKKEMTQRLTRGFLRISSTHVPMPPV